MIKVKMSMNHSDNEVSSREILSAGFLTDKNMFPEALEGTKG